MNAKVVEKSPVAGREHAITAYDVAEHIQALCAELAVMARSAGLFELALLLERTQRVAEARLAAEDSD